jgi:hypothetical protein
VEAIPAGEALGLGRRAFQVQDVYTMDTPGNEHPIWVTVGFWINKSLLMKHQGRIPVVSERRSKKTAKSFSWRLLPG